MRFNRGKIENGWQPYTIAVCAGVLLYVLLMHISVFGRLIASFFRILRPVIYGIIIAYVLNPLCKYVEGRLFTKVRNKKLKRNLSILLTFVIVIIIIAIILGSLIPQIVQSVSSFISNFDTYATSVEKTANELAEKALAYRIDLRRLLDSAGDFIDQLGDTLTKNLDKIIKVSYNFGQGMINLLITAILAIYFLAAKDSVKKGFKHLLQVWLSEKNYKRAIGFLHTCNGIMAKYIVFDLLDGLIVGVANFMLMLIAGMPYASIISVIVGITNLAPTFGPIVGASIGALILLFVKPWYALLFLIFTIVIQTIDGYIIKPKLFGNQLNVSPLLILVFIVVGGRMLGVAGILLSIPLAAILNYLYTETLLPYLDARSKRKAQAAKQAIADNGADEE